MESITLQSQCSIEIDTTIKGETIIIFGGSGSLGTKLVHKWIANNKIVNVSRDEEKQWTLRTSISRDNLHNLDQYIGDISKYSDVEKSILIYNPTIIIIAACLKHIDICEKNPDKAIQMNYSGLQNVIDIVRKYPNRLKSILYVSTDKACDPITTYGYSKALGESLVLSYNNPIKIVGVRYGNVLNSSGSIIPLLDKDKDKSNNYSLTHSEMTRFIMTLNQSINLIEYALIHGKTNEIIIPYICSMKIKDLFELFCEKYGKSYTITGLRCKEKIHEQLLSPTESEYSYTNECFIHITNKKQITSVKPFDSSMFNLSKDQLKDYLIENSFL